MSENTDTPEHRQAVDIETMAAQLREARLMPDRLDALLVERQQQRDEARALAAHWRAAGFGVPCNPIARGYAFPWEKHCDCHQRFVGGSPVKCTRCPSGEASGS